MLDSPNVVNLFHMLEPWITDAIWIGKMNGGVPEKADKQMKSAIRAGQTDERITEIYTPLKKCPKAKWKDSVKKVVGLEMAQKAGLDVSIRLFNGSYSATTSCLTRLGQFCNSFPPR